MIQKARNSFKEKVYLVHKDHYNLDKFIYLNARTKGTAICEKHGEFLTTPSSLLAGASCPKCKTSKGETAIRLVLKKNSIIFREQEPLKRKNKKSLRFDFYLSEYDLYIEYRGEQHYLPVKHFGGLTALFRQNSSDRTKKL